MSFVVDIPVNAGEGDHADLRKILDELGIQAEKDASGVLHCDYTPGSYEPVRVRFFFPADLGIVGLEGELLSFEGEPLNELRTALNYLNVEVDTYRFYVDEQQGVVLVRHDLLPNLEVQPAIHPRELRQALTGLCAQKAIFAESLEQVQGGRSWRFVKDALRAFR